jgi:AraC family transcriptional regulator
MNSENNILYVKNMVCPRCVKVVTDELFRIGFKVKAIELGRVELTEAYDSEGLSQIRAVLENNGFELLDDKKSRLIEKIKILIIEGIREGRFSEMNLTISNYISEQLHMEYTHLSALFSSGEGRSIERYTIQQKVAFIKELISYGELSIKQIADKLGYSSLQALSNQFKKETGITPTGFRQLAHPERTSLDK